MAKAKGQFDGQAVKEIQNKVKGDIGHPVLNTKLNYGDEVTVVYRGRVAGVNHGDGKSGLRRVQILEADEGYLIDGIDAEDLIHKLHAERVKELNALLGTEGLDFDGPQDDID